jgi:hypothetical protein
MAIKGKNKPRSGPPMTYRTARAQVPLYISTNVLLVHRVLEYSHIS